MTADRIIIHSLTLWTKVGVEPQERAMEQKVEIDLELTPKMPLTNLSDDLARTIDYAAVAREVERIARLRHRNLIETLAEEIAQGVEKKFPVAKALVEVRKFILPNTGHVAVRIYREFQA